MIDRRGFLRTLGCGLAAVAAVPLIVEPEPVRRFWQVGRNAPVPVLHGITARVVSVKIGGIEIPVTGARITSVADAERLYGKGSQLAEYIRDRFEYAEAQFDTVIPVGQVGEFRRDIAERLGVPERVLWGRT
jgi:energy-converting hydrogenase Eha subunit A